MKTIVAVLMLLAAAGVLADPVRDPMRPPSAQAPGLAPAAAAAPSVSAVFISATRRVAVVHGRLVRAGDRVGACLVDEVVEEGLRCRQGGYLHLQRTPGSEVAFRTPAAAPAVALNGAP